MGLKEINSAAIDIQRAWRGCLGRQKWARAQLNKERDKIRSRKNKTKPLPLDSLKNDKNQSEMEFDNEDAFMIYKAVKIGKKIQAHRISSDKLHDSLEQPISQSLNLNTPPETQPNNQTFFQDSLDPSGLHHDFPEPPNSVMDPIQSMNDTGSHMDDDVHQVRDSLEASNPHIIRKEANFGAAKYDEMAERRPGKKDLSPRPFMDIRDSLEYQDNEEDLEDDDDFDFIEEEEAEEGEGEVDEDREQDIIRDDFVTKANESIPVQEVHSHQGHKQVPVGSQIPVRLGVSKGPSQPNIVTSDPLSDSLDAPSKGSQQQYRDGIGKAPLVDQPSYSSSAWKSSMPSSKIQAQPLPKKSIRSGYTSESPVPQLDPHLSPSQAVAPSVKDLLKVTEDLSRPNEATKASVLHKSKATHESPSDRMQRIKQMYDQSVSQNFPSTRKPSGAIGNHARDEYETPRSLAPSEQTPPLQSRHISSNGTPQGQSNLSSGKRNRILDSIQEDRRLNIPSPLQATPSPSKPRGLPLDFQDERDDQYGWNKSPQLPPQSRKPPEPSQEVNQARPKGGHPPSMQAASSPKALSRPQRRSPPKLPADSGAQVRVNKPPASVRQSVKEEMQLLEELEQLNRLQQEKEFKLSLFDKKAEMAVPRERPSQANSTPKGAAPGRHPTDGRPGGPSKADLIPTQQKSKAIRPTLYKKPDGAAGRAQAARKMNVDPMKEKEKKAFKPGARDVRPEKKPQRLKNDISYLYARDQPKTHGKQLSQQPLNEETASPVDPGRQRPEFRQPRRPLDPSEDDLDGYSHVSDLSDMAQRRVSKHGQLAARYIGPKAGALSPYPPPDVKYNNLMAMEDRVRNQLKLKLSPYEAASPSPAEPVGSVGGGGYLGMFQKKKIKPNPANSRRNRGRDHAHETQSEGGGNLQRPFPQNGYGVEGHGQEETLSLPPLPSARNVHSAQAGFSHRSGPALAYQDESQPKEGFVHPLDTKSRRVSSRNNTLSAPSRMFHNV